MAPSRGTTSLHSSLKTGRALVTLQLVSRLITFTLNQALVRLASPEVFGTAAIQFDLVYSTVLFLSREGIRNALLRQTEGEAKEEQVRALSNIPLLLGVPVAGAITSLYLWSSDRATVSQSDFYPAFALYVASALIEISSEPFYIRAMREREMRTRIRAEGGMAIVKAAITFCCLAAGMMPLLAFGTGQFFGSVWLVSAWVRRHGPSGWIWASTQGYVVGAVEEAHCRPRWDGPTVSLAMANTQQSVVKHVLTEADRIAVGRLCPLSEQGGYAIAMNYGESGLGE